MKNELAVLRKFQVPELKNTVVENIPVLLYGRSRSSQHDYKCEFHLNIHGVFHYYSRDVSQADLIMGEELDTIMPIRDNQRNYAKVSHRPYKPISKCAG